MIGMAVCGDKGMAALATIWSKNLQVYGCLFSLSFLCGFLEVSVSYFAHINYDGKINLIVTWKN